MSSSNSTVPVQDLAVSYVNIVGFSVELVLCVILGAIIFIKQCVQGRQPLKSRSFVPLLLVLSTAFVCISVLITNIPSLYFLRCFSTAFISIPIGIALLYSQIFQFIRFILLKRLQVVIDRIQKLLGEEQEISTSTFATKEEEDELDVEEEQELKELEHEFSKSPPQAAMQEPAVVVVSSPPSTVTPASDVGLLVTPATPSLTASNPVRETLEVQSSDKVLPAEKVNSNSAKSAQATTPRARVASVKEPKGPEGKVKPTTRLRKAILSDTMKNKRLFKILKASGSTMAAVAVLIVIEIIALIFIVGLFAGLAPRGKNVEAICTNFVLGLIYIVYGAFLGLAVVICIVIAIIDFSSYSKRCFRCKLKKIFITDDPLLFRIDLLCTIFVNFILAPVPFYLRFIGGAELASSTTYIVFQMFGLLAVPGVATYATLYSDIQSAILYRKHAQLRKQKAGSMSLQPLDCFDPSSETIKRLLDLPETAKLFKQFSVKEFNVENILFYEQLQQYYKIKITQQRRRHRLAMQIYENYINPKTAILEINLTAEARHGITSVLTLNAVEATKKKLMTNELFELCEADTMRNLVDVYSRFFRSTAFQTYVAKQKPQDK